MTDADEGYPGMAHDFERMRAEIFSYQASRDWAIDTLVESLGIEADKSRALEYYARLASERVVALEKALDRLQRACRHMAESFNRAGKGEGEEVTDWNRARKELHEARVQARAALSPKEPKP